MRITKTDAGIITVLLLTYIAVSAPATRLAQPLATIVSGAVVVVLLATTILSCYRCVVRAFRFYVEHQNASDHNRLEELAHLLATIRPTAPLPSMRRFAITPDFANVLAREIMRKRPDLVVELGSGVSTLIGGYCLQKVGAGKLVSIEHDAIYAELSRETVKVHGLDAIVEVKYAPLTRVELQGKAWRFYDLPDLGDADIDILVIDGPPSHVQRLARFPALELLFSRLSATASILLDDAARADEREMVQMWRGQHPDLKYEYLETEKGTVILKRG